MHQLSLRPWFFILLFTWLSFFIFAPKKILSHLQLNNSTQEVLYHQTPLWSWPW